MVGGDEQDVAVLLAGLVDDTDGLVGGSNTLDGSLVDTGVTNHVGGSKVVHDKLEVALAKALGHLVTHGGSAHLGLEVIGGNLGRRDHVADLAGELLLNTTVEEESNVSVLLSLSNVALLNILLAQPLGQHVTHVLGREGNREGVVGLVPGHGGDVDVLGVREFGLGRAVVVTQQLSDLTDTVGTVVEEEESVAIYYRRSTPSSLSRGNKTYPAHVCPCRQQ